MAIELNTLDVPESETVYIRELSQPPFLADIAVILDLETGDVDIERLHDHGVQPQAQPSFLSWTLNASRASTIHAWISDHEDDLQTILNGVTVERRGRDIGVTFNKAAQAAKARLDYSEPEGDVVHWGSLDGMSLDDIARIDATTTDAEIVTMAASLAADVLEDALVVGIDDALLAHRESLREEMRNELQAACRVADDAIDDRNDLIVDIAAFDSSHEIASLTGLSASTIQRLIRKAQ